MHQIFDSMNFGSASTVMRMDETDLIDAALFTLRAHLRRRFCRRQHLVERAFAWLQSRLTTVQAHTAVARIYALGLVRRTH